MNEFTPFPYTPIDTEHLAHIFDQPVSTHASIPAREWLEPWRSVKVSVARVSSECDPIARNDEIRLGDLFDSLLATTVGAKKGSAIFQGAVNVSPGPRKDTDVRLMWGFGFDLDKITWKELRRVIARIRKAGVAFTIHPTWSCGLPERGLCYRVWIPFDQSVSTDSTTWAKAYRATGRYFGMPFDEACTNTARLLFLPRQESGRSYARPRHYLGEALSFKQVIKLAKHYEESSKKDSSDDRAQRRRRPPLPTSSEERSRFNAFWNGFRKDFMLADLALVLGKNAREVGDDGDGGYKVTCRCPLEDEHRSPDGPNAAPMVAFNPDHAEHQTATAKCLHATHAETSSCDLAWAFVEDSGPGTWREFLPGDAQPHFDAWLEVQPATRQELDQSLKSLQERFARTMPSRSNTEDVAAVLAVVEKIASRKNDARRVADIEGLVSISRWSKADIKQAVKDASAAFAEKQSNTLTDAPDSRSERDDVLLSTSDYNVNVAKLKRAFLKRNAEDSPLVYVQGGSRPVRLIRTDEKQRLQSMNDQGSWQVALDEVATYRRILSDSVRGTAIPDDIMRAVRASPDLALPPLDCVTTIPIFNASGELLRKRGYAKELRTFYEPFADIEMPDDVSKSDVRIAVDLLFDIIRDVPFSDAFGEDADSLPMYLMDTEGRFIRDGANHLVPNLDRGRASRLHFLASVITPFVLPMLGDGNIPSYHYDKATPGSGASLLLNLRALIETGRRAVTLTLTNSDDETRKGITTMLGEGATTICYDNIKEGTIDSTPLAKLITDGTWSDRALGTNSSVEVKFRGTVILAGNALSFTKELLRRNIPVRIDPAVEDPEARTGFKYAGTDALCDHVLAHRPELVRAILILVQWWINRGRPAGNKVLGSFEAWCRTLGGIFEAADLEGFLESVEAYKSGQSDDGVGEAFGVVSQLWNKHKEFPFAADEIWYAQGGISAPAPTRKDLQGVGMWAAKNLVGKTFNLAGAAVQLRRARTNSGTKYKFARTTR
jgi:hypothetical protein